MPFGKTISHNVSNYMNSAMPSIHKSAFMYHVETRHCLVLNIKIPTYNIFLQINPVRKHHKYTVIGIQ